MGSQNKIALDMRTFLLIAAVAFLALGQDDGSTYHCPDGWHYAEIGSVTECILLGDRTEKVTKADAAVLCQFHGGWLVDLADSRGPAKNNHNGAEVGWYDWMRDEPNDWHRQQCLTFLKLADPVGYGVYHWNDWDCEAVARYICQKPANPL